MKFVISKWLVFLHNSYKVSFLRNSISQKRLKALTVIHNYGIKRNDGTTAAMCLFDTESPDLFSWLLDEMGELSLHSMGRSRGVSNPMKLLDASS